MVSKRQEAAKYKAKVTTKVDKTENLPCKLLIDLPREMRDKIWIAVLSNTRLAMGERGGWRGATVKPKPFGLSILRLCKQIHEETKTLWLKHVLFTFVGLKSMLDKLSPLPFETISRIRYLRLDLSDGDYLFLRRFRADDETDDEADDRTSIVTRYGPVSLFKLLPGLNLNRLTILAYSRGISSYGTLESLINKGVGWKELHYITRDSTMLGFAILPGDVFWENITRKFQPSDWKVKLFKRDGAEEKSKASITIYRSMVSNATNTVLDPSMREVIEQNPSSPQEMTDFGATEIKEFMSEEEVKELLVVVKRGSDIWEPDGPPYEESDIRQWASNAPWSEIKAKGANPWFYEKYAKVEIEIDSYENVEEYKFAPYVSCF